MNYDELWKWLYVYYIIRNWKKKRGKILNIFDIKIFILINIIKMFCKKRTERR